MSKRVLYGIIGLTAIGIMSTACNNKPPPAPPPKTEVDPNAYWDGFVKDAYQTCDEDAAREDHATKEKAIHDMGGGPVPASPPIPQATYASAKRDIKDGTFHYAVHGQPRSCDPHKIYTVIEFGVTINTSEGLITWGAEGPTAGIHPGIAAAWSVSPDGLVYTFAIGVDRKWSNGDPITAQDFVWSWDRAQAKDTGAIYRFLFKEAAIKKYEATDALMFQVTLSETRKFFLDLMTMPIFHPVHPATVEKFKDAWCQPNHWVGSGPFVPTETVTNDHITLEKNPRYWDVANVGLQRAVGYFASNVRVHLDNYKLGKLDWVGPSVTPPSADLDQITDPVTRAFTVRDATSYARAANTYISTNVARKGLGDPRVRKALSLAIDRKILADKILKSGDVPTMTFIPPGLSGYRNFDVPVQHECSIAQQLLAEAGFPKGAGFPKYEFLYRSNSENEPKLASAIAQMWKECLGIEVTTTGLPMNIWQSKVPNKDYDITFDGWQGDYPHPQTFAQLLQCGAETNNSGWCNKQYDAVLAKAAASNTPAEMQRHYCVLERIAAQDEPTIPLFFSPRINFLRPEWTGFHGNVMLYHPLKFLRMAQTARL